MVKAAKVLNSMILEYKVGLNDKGEDIIRRQKFSKVKLDVPVEDMYRVAEAFEPLLQFGLSNIKQQEDSLIVEE